ncbi:MAG: dethiobiotin synthase [Kofleriaceae bacterium]
MKQGYFVTGTGTGVGKTFVSVALLRLARSLGMRAFGFKPIETGCVGLGEDQRALVAAAGEWQTGDLAGLLQFELPAAPLVAAAVESRAIDLESIRKPFERGANQADFVLVEGAGGWRVPITPESDMSTLAAMLKLPVIVAASATLGTINHSLLTVEAIERDGQSVAAVILSQRPDDPTDLIATNVSEIERRWNGRVLVLQQDPQVLASLF